MKRLLFFAGMTFGIALFSCSDDEDDNKGLTSTASFPSYADGKANLNFTGDQADQVYILLPYHTGSIDTVNGATEAKSTFTVSGAGASLRAFSPAFGLSPGLSQEQTEKSLRNLQRQILNRFRPEKGYQGQSPGFWQTVRRVEEAMSGLPSLGAKAARDFRQHLESQIQAASAKKDRGPGPLRLSGSGCYFADGAGSDVSEILTFTSSASTANKQIHEQVDGTDFCMAFLEGSGYALTNKTALQNTIRKSLDLLKNVIYKGQGFAEKGIEFLPQFIFTDPKYIGSPGITGGHVLAATREAGLPVLVMAYDLNAIGKDESDASVGELHGTIIHELQHAVHYFFRSSDDKLDSTYIDEGLAHMVEDLAGYSDNNNFSNYAFSFLLTRSTGESPFFNDSLTDPDDPDLDTKGRGAGHAFFYYLASQKGGFEFSDGLLTGGKGTGFLASLTTSGQYGLKNVRDLYTTSSLNWNQTIGNYLASLMLDNNNLVASVDPAHKVFDPLSNVTDLQGKANKGFGMHFNSFKDLDNATADGNLTSLTDSSFSLYFYQTKPLLLKVSSGNLNISIETAADNAGLAMVRVK